MTTKRLYGKFLFLLLIMLAAFMLSGCRVDSELWFEKTGAGHGVVKVTGWLGPKESLEAEMKRSKLKDYSISGGNGVYEIKFKWSDIDDVASYGSSMTPDKDGLAKLVFPNRDYGSTTVHVPGSIVKEKTDGNITASDTVIFEGRGGVIYFRPGTTIGKIITYILIALGIVVAGVIAYSFLRKKPATGNSATVAAPAAKFCGGCGTPVQVQDVFCGSCGNKVR
ncbi:MAG: hypothetical protein ACOYW7_08885 [Nitrospirota bacterium]